MSHRVRIKELDVSKIAVLLMGIKEASKKGFHSKVCYYCDRIKVEIDSGVLGYKQEEECI